MNLYEIDAERYAAEQEEELEKLPKCECCGEPIRQEKEKK